MKNYFVDENRFLSMKPGEIQEEFRIMMYGGFFLGEDISRKNYIKWIAKLIISTQIYCEYDVTHIAQWFNSFIGEAYEKLKLEGFSRDASELLGYVIVDPKEITETIQQILQEVINKEDPFFYKEELSVGNIVPFSMN